MNVFIALTGTHFFIFICELYHEEEDLWNFSSAENYKTEKRDAALERIKEAMASSILLTGTFIHK